MIARCLILSWAAVLACACGGGGQGFVGVGEAVVPSGLDRQAQPTVDYGRGASVNVEPLLRDLREAQGDRRDSLLRQILAAGPGALPTVERFAAFNKDPNLSLDLLYLQTQLERADQQSAPGESETDRDRRLPPPPPRRGGGGTDSDELPAAYGITDVLDDEGVPPDDADRIVKIRYGQALDCLKAGDHAGAAKVCEAILILLPATRYRKQVQQLLSFARGKTRARTLLAGKLAFSRNTMRFARGKSGGVDKPPTLNLYLRNMSDAPLTVDFGDGDEIGGRTLLTMDVRVREQDIIGTSMSTGAKSSVPLAGRPIILQPGESCCVETPVSNVLDLLRGREGTTLTTVSVRAELRLARLQVEGEDDEGDIEPSDVGPSMDTAVARERMREAKRMARAARSMEPLALDPAMISVMPESFPLDEASAGPLVFLKKAVESNNAVSVFLCSRLITQEQRREALDCVLAPDIDGVGVAMRRARLFFSVHLTERNFGSDTSAWTAWWKAHRLEY